eukprot:TRINITY_DN4219_c0_g1_i2.p1 TRINITY_DN4219_c0_g1~~TRINITY_DN4219_c0_g1_i2.p1  ORF type:complete len:539 (+),score=111.33 TRINITY_DN4219_c0_g1_i2:91-1617(+)
MPPQRLPADGTPRRRPPQHPLPSPCVSTAGEPSFATDDVTNHPHTVHMYGLMGQLVDRLSTLATEYEKECTARAEAEQKADDLSQQCEELRLYVEDMRTRQPAAEAELVQVRQECEELRVGRAAAEEELVDLRSALGDQNVLAEKYRQSEVSLRTCTEFLARAYRHAQEREAKIDVLTQDLRRCRRRLRRSVRADGLAATSESAELAVLRGILERVAPDAAAQAEEPGCDDDDEQGCEQINAVRSVCVGPGGGAHMRRSRVVKALRRQASVSPLQWLALADAVAQIPHAVDTVDWKEIEAVSQGLLPSDHGGSPGPIPSALSTAYQAAEVEPSPAPPPPLKQTRRRRADSRSVSGGRRRPSGRRSGSRPPSPERPAERPARKGRKVRVASRSVAPSRSRSHSKERESRGTSPVPAFAGRSRVAQSEAAALRGPSPVQTFAGHSHVAQPEAAASRGPSPVQTFAGHSHITQSEATALLEATKRLLELKGHRLPTVVDINPAAGDRPVAP